MVLALAGCTGPRENPRVIQSPPAPPAAVALPPTRPWTERPLTPGDWQVASSPARNSVARFGVALSGGNVPAVSFTCEPAQRRVAVWLANGKPGPVMVLTTSGSRNYVASPLSLGATPGVGFSVDAMNPQLDAILFSRGRFALALAGSPVLVLPVRPDIARVVEDCRG